MQTWTRAEAADFVDYFSDLWPGALTFTRKAEGKETSALVELWVQTLQRYPVEIAKQALSEIKEHQDFDNRPPSMKVARQEVEGVLDRLKALRRQMGRPGEEPAVSMQELAADDAFWAAAEKRWEGKFDSRNRPLVERHRLWRKHLAAGRFPFGDLVLEAPEDGVEEMEEFRF